MTSPKPIRSIRTVKKMTPVRAREAGMGREEYTRDGNACGSEGCRAAKKEPDFGSLCHPPVPHRPRRNTMRRFVLRTATIAGAIVAAACVEYAPNSPTANTASTPTAGSPTLQVIAAPANAKSYVINFVGTQLPSDLAAQVSAAGGTVTTSIDQIGVAVAASSDPGFAARAGKIKGVSDVTEDIEVQWVPPDRVVEAGEVTEAGSVDATTAFGTGETFRRAQWVPDAMSAPAAWDAGNMGAGARVAIVDGGIRDTHI